MPSTSFSALCGCPQNINCTWNCDLCGCPFISISYSLIPQHWLPPWYVCCVPAHLHTCLPSSQQKRYENTAFSELYSSRVITLLPSHYLASVASLCFHQHLCPHAYIFFVNLLNSFNQWLFNISANGRDFLQRRPQSPSAKRCWAALILSGFFVTASLHSFIPYLLFPLFYGVSL